MNDGHRKRPRFGFQNGHDEAGTHCLLLTAPVCRRIPVPIGPAVPRRDRPQVFERYARLMLILFKPWRSHNDLCRSGQPWSEAFAEFHQECSPLTQKYMDNMQVLHECKDSRDDHFEERR
ncbi:hypothetical protein EV360DRAFT_37618, partial [Lentinula raphanica]